MTGLSLRLCRLAPGASFQDFISNLLLQLAHRSNLVTAISALDVDMVGNLTVEGEAVVATHGAFQFYAHEQMRTFTLW
jgi:hypothetical protein